MALRLCIDLVHVGMDSGRASFDGKNAHLIGMPTGEPDVGSLNKPTDYCHLPEGRHPVLSLPGDESNSAAARAAGRDFAGLDRGDLENGARLALGLRSNQRACGEDRGGAAKLPRYRPYADGKYAAQERR